MIRAAASLLVAAGIAAGYPLDAYPRTGIRRLLGYQLAQAGKIKGVIPLPPGALLASAQIALRLRGRNGDFDINPRTPQDPYLLAGLERVFGARHPSYAAALLDISEPARPRYAAWRAEQKQIPGSVGKLLVATGLYGALARDYPDDIAARERVLRETWVTADTFVYRDGKTVPVFNEGDAAVVNKRVEAGDRYRLWEWIDHMLSQSSNAAGSMVWKQAMLMHRFGRRYPVPQADQEALFRNAPKPELTKLALEALETYLTASGLDTGKLRLGTFFTRNASAVVPGAASYACPNELLRWLIKMEQGKLVDAWSSLELKRMLYFARPRYRYVSAPALGRAAVFFKSGSLFECAPEPGYVCAQYKGNKTNLMHSVAVVESGRKVYLVAMMSNVLRLNSAVEHQTIATEIEKLIQGRPEDR